MSKARGRWMPYAVLAVGVFAASWAAILIRLAAAPPLVTGAYRLTLGSLLLTPAALWEGKIHRVRLTLRDGQLILASGLFLGLHFAAWISSLDYTSVASSVALVAMSPVFVGLAAHFALGERLRGSMLFGIAIAAMGSMIISWGSVRASGSVMRGDLLALIGAVMVSGYLLIGRKLRQRLPLLSYVTPTYWTAALVLLTALAVSGEPLGGYSWRTYALFLLLALGPQVIGHTSFNWALRYLSPTFVAASVLGEPIGSTILAGLVLRERPTLVELAGGAAILLGIYICSRVEASQPSAKGGDPSGSSAAG